MSRKKSKKYSVYSRILAMMLTMVLLLTSSGFQVLAQDMPNDSTVEAAQLEENDAEEPELEEMATAQEETSTPSEDPEETPAPSEDPEATPTPSEEPEVTPTPSEDSEVTPTPVEDPEVTPTPVEDPEAPAAELKNDQLTFEVESTSVEEGTGLVEIKVHYSLGEDAEESVTTFLHVEGQSNVYFTPEFDKTKRYTYTNDDGKSFKLSTNPDAKQHKIRYYLEPGDDFTQTFKVGVSGLEAGESADFTVRLEVESDSTLENCIVDDKKYELTYTQTEDGENQNTKSILDLQPGESMTVQATFGGARGEKISVDITAYGTEWINYGRLGTYSTRPYHVSFTLNGKSISKKAFCIQPPAVGPTVKMEYEVEEIDNDTFAKVCYYVENPTEGFFAEEAAANYNWSTEEQFVLGHIASAKLLEGGEGWKYNTNELAQATVERFINYCKDSKSISFSSENLTVNEYYKDGSGWRQRTTTTKLNSEEMKYTTSLPLNVQLHVDDGVNKLYSGSATVDSGTTFHLSAPLIIDPSVNEHDYASVTQTQFSYDNFWAYKLVTQAKTSNGNDIQNLALVFGNASPTTITKSFRATFTTGSANISVNKTDATNNPLSGAEFKVIANNVKGVPKDTTVATFTTGSDGKGSTGELPPGTYILRETKAPNGYVTAADIPFSVADNGTVTVTVGNRSDVSFDDGTTTVTIIDEKNETSISGEKTWNVPDGFFTLPESITVQLLRDNQPILQEGSTDVDPATLKTVKPDADNNWTYTWSNLLKYEADANGKIEREYVYTVRETEIEVNGTKIAIDSTIGHFILSDGRGEFVPTVSDKVNINNRITGTTEVSGEKIWHDDQDSDRIRPESITIQLLCKNKNTGEELTTWDYSGPKEKTITATNNWKYSFTNLPKYSTDGKIEYEYSVDEKEVPRGYTRRIDGYDIINTHVASTSVWFKGTKELEGRNLQNGEFKFNLYKVTENGEIVEKLQTVTNNAKGVFSFDTIRYTGSGTHYYRITEEKETLGGVTYDETIYDIRVIVSVGGENNDYYTINKYITKVVGSEKTTVDEIRFNNQYHASGEIVIGNIMKTLENSPLAAGQFTFELKDELGNVLQTATNNADGSVTFGALKYTEKDIDKEYTYTVSEVNNHVTGVTYDETVYTVKVKVEDSDPSDGTLKITQETLSGTTPVETMTYKNSFKGSVKLHKTGQDDVVLPNAKFQLYMQNASGEWVLYKVDETTPEEYVTDENGMITVEDLAAGNYYFVETEAPLGYVISKEEDGSSKKYYFTIGIKDGDAGIVENAEVDQEINIENDANPDDTTIAVTKLVTRNGEEFELIDETFYVALFEDEDLTVRVSDVKPIEFKNASASTVYFTGLKFGKSYYVSETDQEGNVIETGVIGEDGVFYVDFAEGNYAEINEGDGTQTIIFENQIITIPRGYYKEGELTITKKLIGADGAAKSSNGVFYAGIFADKEHTQLSDLAEENIVKLDLNGNSSVSKTVKIALHPEEETTLYVTEVDENGKPVADAKDFKYVVTVDGSTVTMDAENTKATVVITNCEEEEDKSTETEKPKITPTVESQKETKTAVKTGDDTPIAPFAAMLGVSVLAVFLLVLAQKRRKNS